jgi:hypothetical protein
LHQHRDDDDPWLLAHLPRVAPDATRVKPLPNTRGGEVKARPVYELPSIPLPEPEPHSTRENWLMSHISDMLPIVGEMRGMQAAHSAARSGHLGSAALMAGLSALPMGSRLAKAAVPRIAKAAIQLPDGSIHWAANHAAAIDEARRAGALPDWRSPKFAKILSKSVDGFVDESGAFLTRDETTQRLRDLGSKIEGAGLSSEELRYLSPKKREKVLAPEHALPFRGERPYEETFPLATVPKQFAILTAENPNGAAQSAAANRAANAKLAGELKAQGLTFKKVKGAYTDETSGQTLHENSFLVHGIEPDVAARLGRKYGQNGIVTHEGYHDLANGRLFPSSGLQLTDEMPYTELPNGSRIQSKIDWSNPKSIARVAGDSVAVSGARRVPNLGDGVVPQARPGMQYPGTPAGQQQRELDDMVKKFGPKADSVAAAPFFSRVSRAIETAPFKKGTAEQWNAHLGKNSALGERQWSGVDQFLKENSGKVLTRDQVAAAHTPIELGQKTLGAVNLEQRLPQGYTVFADEDGGFGVRDPKGKSMFGGDNPVGHDGWTTSRDSAIRQALKHLGIKTDDVTPKFAQYTEPGGSNYREKLITLGGVDRRSRQERYNALVAGGMPLAEAHRAVDESMPLFRSSHFDEPNILAHLRLKDRELPNGEKVLHIEELQSDWHQKGRASGYATDLTPDDHAKINELQQKINAHRPLSEILDDVGLATRRGDADALFEANRERMNRNELVRQRDAIIDKRRAGVPDAPFKKTEDWQLLGLKHAIHDAVHGGYDRVAWTPGELQNARYDLSKHVDELRYRPASGKFTASMHGSLVHEGTYAPEALEAVIGKDAAARLLNNPTNKYTTGAGDIQHMLSGEDLKIGGSGMRGFYDNMLPKTLNNYMKQLGLPPAEIQATTGLTGDTAGEGWRLRYTDSGEELDPMRRYTRAEAQRLAQDWGREQGESVEPFLPASASGPALPSFKITPELARIVKQRGQALWGLAPIVAAGKLFGGSDDQ